MSDLSDSHITNIGLNETSRDPKTLVSSKTVVPGPSTNPATNMLINDILLRSVGRISRMTVEKAILGKQYGKEMAKSAVENRSMASTLFAYGITKVATRSLPGAALVGTGLLVKTLFDRSQTRREAFRKGTRTLQKTAEDE